MSETIEDRLKEKKTELDAWKELPPFGKFKDGENTLQLLTNVSISETAGKFGKQTLYTVILNGETVRLNIPPSVEIPILKGYQKKKIQFTITKTGSGMQTRYKVK